MSDKIFETGAIGFRLPVKSPYIITAHHLDYYPKGNEKMGPVDFLTGQNIGDDFNLEAPWRMYYGDVIPGFPVHPHRGFETVTVVEQGFVDHTDSLGGAGRYGEGDVQWLTAGGGVQHCEMFPLIHQDRENTMELFQIWLNLPSKNKMVTPHYKMLWHENIPIVQETDGQGKKTSIKIVAGSYGEVRLVSPPPDSWAYPEENGVAIWILTMEPGATYTLRAASKTAGRMMYFYRGDSIELEGTTLKGNSYADVAAGETITIKNGNSESKILLLEGEPINEPVAARGPFVMNNDAEIMQAYYDYQRTQFGGWPWDIGGPVSPRDSGRFAKYSDGSVERPGK